MTPIPRGFPNFTINNCKTMKGKTKRGRGFVSHLVAVLTWYPGSKGSKPEFFRLLFYNC